MGLLADGQQLRLIGRVAEEPVPEAVPSHPDLGHPLNERCLLKADQSIVDRPPR